MNKLKPCQMTAEEAIKILESVTFISSKRASAPGDTSDIEALRMAISALRAQPANEPLTLEQLKQMKGEPVWIQETYCGRWNIAGSVDARRRNGKKMYRTAEQILYAVEDYGKTWLAYAHKPGGEQDA